MSSWSFGYVLPFPNLARWSWTASVEDDATGKDIAQLQTFKQMTDYWSAAEDLPYRDKDARATVLTRYYPPDLEFGAGKGRSEYLVILRGESPLPRPATVKLSVALNGGDPQVFTFPLPEGK